jgi:hypothetical protein
MHIPNVPPSLFISTPDELIRLIGQEIWSCGQGGITPIQEPYNMGKLTHVFFEKSYAGFTTTRRIQVSLKDRHVQPQTYNNWYLCKSQSQAEELTKFLQTKWDTHPEYEAARQGYADECSWWDDIFDTFDNY